MSPEIPPPETWYAIYGDLYGYAIHDDAHRIFFVDSDCQFYLLSAAQLPYLVHVRPVDITESQNLLDAFRAMMPLFPTTPRREDA